MTGDDFRGRLTKAEEHPDDLLLRHIIERQNVEHPFTRQRRLRKEACQRIIESAIPVRDLMNPQNHDVDVEQRVAALMTLGIVIRETGYADKFKEVDAGDGFLNGPREFIALEECQTVLAKRTITAAIDGNESMVRTILPAIQASQADNSLFWVSVGGDLIAAMFKAQYFDHGWLEEFGWITESPFGSDYDSVKQQIAEEVIAEEKQRHKSFENFLIAAGGKVPEHRLTSGIEVPPAEFTSSVSTTTTNSENLKTPSDKTDLSPEEIGLGILVMDPEITVTKLALRIGVSRTHVYKMPRLKAALEVRANRNARGHSIPRGSKDADGNLEAYDDQ